MADGLPDMKWDGSEWVPLHVLARRHDHKGHSEEMCIRCGWIMGQIPLNCQNNDTPHVFPSQHAEIERLRAERDAERALADRLARSLLDGAFRSNRYYRMHGPSWVEVHGALDAYEEARRG